MPTAGAASQPRARAGSPQFSNKKDFLLATTLAYCFIVGYSLTSFSMLGKFRAPTFIWTLLMGLWAEIIVAPTLAYVAAEMGFESQIPWFKPSDCILLYAIPFVWGLICSAARLVDPVQLAQGGFACPVPLLGARFVSLEDALWFVRRWLSAFVFFAAYFMSGPSSKLFALQKQWVASVNCLRSTPLWWPAYKRFVAYQILWILEIWFIGDGEGLSDDLLRMLLVYNLLRTFSWRWAVARALGVAWTKSPRPPGNPASDESAAASLHAAENGVPVGSSGCDSTFRNRRVLQQHATAGAQAGNCPSTFPQGSSAGSWSNLNSNAGACIDADLPNLDWDHALFWRRFFQTPEGRWFKEVGAAHVRSHNADVAVPHALGHLFYVQSCVLPEAAGHGGHLVLASLANVSGFCTWRAGTARSRHCGSSAPW